MPGFRSLALFSRPILLSIFLLSAVGCDRFGGGGFGYRPRTDYSVVLLFFVIGALLGAFFSERFRKYRKYVWMLLMALLAIAAMESGVPLVYAAWFIIGFVTAFKLLKDKAAAARKHAKPTTFGSAEWADFDYIRRNGITGEAGYLLGWFEADGKRHPIHYTGDRHLLTVAPTRAGKGVSAIIPNLLTYKGSALVIDPKGENALITARQRKALGQDIHVVDPWGITGMQSARFNPLDWLDPNDPDVGENALMLADALIIRSGKGESAFWDEESIALLWGFILYVALDTDPEQERTLGRVRDLISLNEDPINEQLAKMYQHSNEIVSGTAARTLAKEPKVRSNVFTSLQSQTHFLDSPRIRESIKKSDFRFEDLKSPSKQMTVYLVLPADRLGTFGRWLRLLIQQAITVNARNIELKPERPILFLLDEMAALGKLTKVEEAFGLMAGFGMQMWGIVQDLSQLDRIYDKGWETFIGNSGVLQYFGSRDHKTAEYFSKLCGVSTIEKSSLSRALTQMFGGQGGGSSTNSSTIDVIQRPLAFPDELMVMRKSQELLLIENFNPIDAQKIIWYKDDRLKQLGADIQGSRSKLVAGTPAAISPGGPVRVYETSNATQPQNPLPLA